MRVSASEIVFFNRIYRIKLDKIKKFLVNPVILSEKVPHKAG